MIAFLLRKLAAVVAVALTVGMLVSTADARAGGGFSAGSRGTRTFTAPPATRTAPTVAPMQRTVTQPTSPTSPSTFGSATRPGGFFSRPGLLGGLAAGFLGAGLFGMLFGHGLMGGLGGIASFLGLLLQVGLVVGIGWFLWTMWQRRQQPAFAGAGAGAPAGSAMFQHAGGAGFGAGSGSAPSDTVEITPADFDAFEQLLGQVETAYGAEDIAGLRALATPEVLSYLSEDLAANASRGVVNKISDVKLLQGDLSEAWRENGVDYATVAMRYGIVDRTVDRASGRMVDGSDTPKEVTEVWTFMRVGGGKWVLSAIQQT